MFSKNLSIKRISNDIKEVNKNPIEGIGIISLDNDIKKYILNIMLLSGPYKYYCLQLLLTFPDDYPITPPKVLIYPGQLFDNLYHHHIFNDEKRDESGKCFKKLCIDLLDNDFMSTKSEHTGWNPSYTISSLLMQLQIFLSNPDLSENSMPKPYQIQELMESMNNYQRIFIVKDENKEITKIHTWKNPYPKMYFKNKEVSDKANSLILEGDKKKIIKENLTCFITKMNIFEDPNIILGYPIVKKYSNIIYPIPEILSYEGYLAQLSKGEDNYFESSLKSANNDFYQSWLPIYINAANFELNKQTILNSFSVIKFGMTGKESYDFKPEYIYDVMLKLFNQMICDIKEKKLSNSYLRAFFQYILLYKKLTELYPYELYEFNEFDYIKKNDIIPIIKKTMILSLFNDFSLLENELNKLKQILKNNLAFQFIYEKDNCNLKNPHEFIEYLEENHLYNSIFEIMRFERNIFLYNGKNLKKIIKNKILNSFKEFLLNSDPNTKNQMKKLILKNMDFYKFIDFGLFLDIPQIDEESEKEIKNIFSDFVILQYIKTLIRENNFINQLENNFGVHLDIEETIEKLTGIINNLEKCYNKEIDIEYLDKSLFAVHNIIKELFILFDNTKEEIDYIEYINYYKESYKGIRIIFNDFLFEEFFISDFNYFILDVDRIKKTPYKFYKIENMKLDDLKLLYLYSFERLKKSINKNNNNLTLIESIFFDLNNNNNKNKSHQWYNYISERQAYEYENREVHKKKNLLGQKQTMSLFFEAKIINEILLSEDINIELLSENCSRKRGSNFFDTAIIKNIIKFANILREKKYNNKYIIPDSLLFHSSIIRYTKYCIDINDSLIEKLEEIYNAGDITLLTFYEFIYLEEHYDICDGFLSSLRNHVIYNFRMKDTIIKNKHEQSKEMKRINKKEKILNNNLKNQIFKIKRNKKINFNQMKFNFRKALRPVKDQRKNYFKYIS